ncbi:MAG TPA: hypothetical protein VJP79_03965 [Nitrososphaera sp.]|nr:hypothetical protein [Nitrososphaera sp.]
MTTTTTTTISSQEFTCSMCNMSFDTAEALHTHEKSHLSTGMQKNKIQLPHARTVAVAAGITTGILVAAIVAWRMSKRKSQP